jgi:hypothetical protein
MTWAFEQWVQPAGAKLLLVTLADYADSEGYCYPSQATLATRTCQSERAVRGHLGALEEAGIIRREVRRDRRGRRTSDAFVLVGFVDAQQPADTAGSAETNRQQSYIPTGNNRTSQPAESAAIYMNEPSVEPSDEPSDLSAAPAARPRRRDELFDAVLDCWLPGRKSEVLTRAARGTLNAAVADLRRVGATPEEVRRRWAVMVAQFTSGRSTPAALAKHWPALEGINDGQQTNHQPGAPGRAARTSAGEGGAAGIAARGYSYDAQADRVAGGHDPH